MFRDFKLMTGHHDPCDWEQGRSGLCMIWPSLLPLLGIIAPLDASLHCEYLGLCSFQLYYFRWVRLPWCFETLQLVPCYCLQDP